MTDDALQARLTKLRQMLALATDMPEEAAELTAKIAALEAQLADPPSSANTGQTGGVNAAGLRAESINAIVGRDYIIKNFYSGTTPEDGGALLLAYLRSLAERCRKLHLARISGQQRTGANQRTVPTLGLEQIYINLITDGPEQVAARPRTRTKQRAMAIVARLNRWRDFDERTDAMTSADDVRIVTMGFDAAHHGVTTPVVARFQYGVEKATSFELPNRLEFAFHPSQAWNDLDATVSVQLSLFRPELAIDAIVANRKLVLLGEPGGGKSTVLRHLALLLAQRALGQPVTLLGWPPDAFPIPIYLPLGTVARAMREKSLDADAALIASLGAALDGALRPGLLDHLRSAVRDGGVILLLDGLDELPAETVRGAVAGAIRRLSDESQSRIVVTSRVRPYARSAAWQLTADDGWAQRTLQPLRFGQVRAFVAGWYAGVAQQDGELSDEDATKRADDLLAQMESFAPIRRMVDTPLLLTMVALLHYNKERVPRDKPLLFEEIVKLLLERWEPRRNPDLDEQPSLLERIALDGSHSATIRAELQKLAYAAHRQPPGDDGRGLIDAQTFKDHFTAFFARLRLADPDALTTKLTEALTDDAGLLSDLGDDSFAFPHLQLEEYLAACHLAAMPEAQLHSEAYKRWQGTDWDRWSEPLQLLVGRLREENKLAGAVLPWLRLLANPTVQRTERWEDKAPGQRRRDALLAAYGYEDMGGRERLTSLLPPHEQTRFEDDLRGAIVDLLAEAEPGIVVQDRIRAARLLAELGDRRFPVTDAQWRAERFDQPFTKMGSHYWRAVPEGNYRIGGWESRKLDAIFDLPQFWVARFPVTVAQYAAFVNVGYAPEARRFWTPEGWEDKGERTEPYGWDETHFTIPNQPVIGITWYEAAAFCAWLNERLRGTLPHGYVVRLPSEAEWEVTAAYAGPGRRTEYPWGDAPEPTPELAVYDWYEQVRPAPVGCCPAGASAGGALDMAGNVWEWTASIYEDYPAKSLDNCSDVLTHETPALRGGSWYLNGTYVRCGARGGYRPDNGDDDQGLRLFVAPRSLIRADC